jgi:hypothetical protein
VQHGGRQYDCVRLRGARSTSRAVTPFHRSFMALGDGRHKLPFMALGDGRHKLPFMALGDGRPAEAA